MFILFGISDRNKMYKFTVRDTCGICGNVGDMRVVKTYSCFDLFFIPIIVWNVKYYLTCSKCGAVKEISKAEFKMLKNTQAQTALPLTKEEEDTCLKTQIKSDIDKVVKKYKNLDLEKNSELLNKFLLKIKEGLLKKYKDEKMVNEAVKEYFSTIFE